METVVGRIPTLDQAFESNRLFRFSLEDWAFVLSAQRIEVTGLIRVALKYEPTIWLSGESYLAILGDQRKILRVLQQLREFNFSKGRLLETNSFRWSPAKLIYRSVRDDSRIHCKLWTQEEGFTLYLKSSAFWSPYETPKSPEREREEKGRLLRLLKALEPFRLQTYGYYGYSRWWFCIGEKPEEFIQELISQKIIQPVKKWNLVIKKAILTKLRG